MLAKLSALALFFFAGLSVCGAEELEELSVPSQVNWGTVFRVTPKFDSSYDNSSPSYDYVLSDVTTKKMYILAYEKVTGISLNFVVPPVEDLGKQYQVIAMDVE
ncbi:hypothetical protein V8E55_011748 [Tylopilus felleus]